MGQQFLRVAAGDRSLAFSIEKNTVITDGKNTRQLVGDRNHGRAHAVAQRQDQVVEPARTDGIEPAEGSSKKEHLGIERDGARQSQALLHAAADLRRVVVFKAVKTDQREL